MGINASLFIVYLFCFAFKGFNLMFDRVAVQGLPNSNRSVTEYRISYSVDNQVYTNINNQVRAYYQYLLIINYEYIIN